MKERYLNKDDLEVLRLATKTQDYNGKLVAQLASRLLKAEARIAELEKVNRWIPVTEKDKLPAYGRPVLIKTEFSVVPKIGTHSPTIPQWSTTDGLYYNGNTYSQVTHWRPLPPPIKDVSNE